MGEKPRVYQDCAHGCASGQTHTHTHTRPGSGTRYQAPSVGQLRAGGEAIGQEGCCQLPVQDTRSAKASSTKPLASRQARQGRPEKWVMSHPFL
jgi:hypothetical protein